MEYTTGAIVATCTHTYLCQCPRMYAVTPEDLARHPRSCPCGRHSANATANATITTTSDAPIVL